MSAVLLKQATCAPLSYPHRAAVADPNDWDDAAYNPAVYHAPVISDESKLPNWADEMNVPAEVVGSRLSYVGGVQTTVSQVCTLDGKTGKYRNPNGKTGLRGRGLLGRWGANHAADCIVTRLNPATGEPQALVVERVDGAVGSCLAWPAGMVEPGDDVPQTLRAELTQEAIRDTDAVDRLFSDACRRGVVYRGFVDDHRNTDEAWMETTAVHFHADKETASALELSTRDKHEVRRSYWVNLADVTAMYASHYDWLQKVRDDIMPGIVAESLQADEVLVVEDARPVSVSPHAFVVVGVGVLAALIFRLCF